MKKILGLVALFVIIVLSCFYFFIQQPKNIFDEIYQETEKTYLGNNVFNNLKDVEVINIKSIVMILNFIQVLSMREMLCQIAMRKLL